MKSKLNKFRRAKFVPPKVLTFDITPSQGIEGSIEPDRSKGRCP
ncbi:2801_t:CDS:1, partial [Dentiscutata erythropus]